MREYKVNALLDEVTDQVFINELQNLGKWEPDNNNNIWYYLQLEDLIESKDLKYVCSVIRDTFDTENNNWGLIKYDSYNEEFEKSYCFTFGVDPETGKAGLKVGSDNKKKEMNSHFIPVTIATTEHPITKEPKYEYYLGTYSIELVLKDSETGETDKDGNVLFFTSVVITVSDEDNNFKLNIPFYRQRGIDSDEFYSRWTNGEINDIVSPFLVGKDRIVINKFLVPQFQAKTFPTEGILLLIAGCDIQTSAKNNKIEYALFDIIATSHPNLMVTNTNQDGTVSNFELGNAGKLMCNKSCSAFSTFQRYSLDSGLLWIKAPNTNIENIPKHFYKPIMPKQTLQQWIDKLPPALQQSPNLMKALQIDFYTKFDYLYKNVVAKALKEASIDVQSTEVTPVKELTPVAPIVTKVMPTQTSEKTSEETSFDMPDLPF